MSLPTSFLNRRGPRAECSARRPRLRAALDGLLVTALFLLSGCPNHSPENPVQPSLPTAFTTTGSTEQPSRWWTTFNDPALNQTIETALADNPSLAAAAERLRAARSLLRQSQADRWPRLNTSADARSEEESSDPKPTETLTLGLEASFELDLWGRLADRARAERLRAEATGADLSVAALSLSAETARTVFRLRESRARQHLLREQLQTNEQIRQLLQTRFDNGRIRAADLLRQEQLLEATRERYLAASARTATLQNLLSTLKGKVPRPPEPSGPDAPPSSIHATPLPGLPPLPQTGLPARLLQIRPDLQAAWLRLQAADREVAAAISNRFPRLTLTGSLTTTEEDGVSALFDDWFQSLAAGMVLPVFDAGARRATVDQRRAVRAEALQLYRQTALTALREVEDALVRERFQSQRLANLRRQLDLARQTLRQLRVQYSNGTGDYIDVLTALTDTQQLQRDVLIARRELLEFRIALYRALAGRLPDQFTTKSSPS